MSTNLNATAGSLRKEAYEQPLLTRHQPLLDVTGKSTDTGNKQTSDAALLGLAEGNPIKAVADTPSPKTTDAKTTDGNKNGSPEKGATKDTDKNAMIDKALGVG